MATATTSPPATVTILQLQAATTLVGTELIEAVQTSGGVANSVQVSLASVATLGGGIVSTGILAGAGIGVATTATTATISLANATQGSVFFRTATTWLSSLSVTTSLYMQVGSPTLNDNAWTQAAVRMGTDFTNAGSGAASSANEFVLNVQANVLSPTNSTVAYEKALLLIEGVTNDPSAAGISRALVAGDFKCQISSTNANGQVWCLSLEPACLTGGDGNIQGIEIDCFNWGSSQPNVAGTTSKYGMQIVAFGGSNPNTAAIWGTKIGTGSFFEGLYFDSAVITTNGHFLQHNQNFNVTYNGLVNSWGAGSGFAVASRATPGSVTVWTMYSQTGTLQWFDSVNSADAMTLGTASGLNVTKFINSGGFSRVTSNFGVLSSTTFVNVTGLSASLVTAGTYQFEAVLYATAGNTGGMKAQIACAAGASNIIYDGVSYAAGAVVNQARATALLTAVATATTATTPTFRIVGNITAATTGALTVQIAQVAATTTTTLVLAGSSLTVFQVT